MSTPPPRLVPARAFPPYTYTGSPQPHPVRDAAGHSHGVEEAPPAPLQSERWRQNEDYLHGIDLFNHGYYWEAHEAWEGLWIAAGKKGAISELLRGLIKLTAAGVKARQGLGEGVRKHGGRAGEHFRRAADLAGTRRIAGLDLGDLEAFARHLVEHAHDWPQHRGADVAVVFDRFLRPRDA